MSHVFVNINGEPVSLDPSLHAVPKAAKPQRSFHNGWRVVGIPVGAMEEARRRHQSDLADAERRAEKDKTVRVPKPWDEEVWRNKFKKPAVRSKPYEIPEAARLCKEMAERAGWTYVDVVEIKKELRA